MKALISTRTRQYGFSLVELMIALVLGLVLTAGAINIFIANKATYQTMEGLSRIQENARFVYNIMSRDIRMADYTGCYQGSGGNVENILNDTSNLGWDLGRMVYGYNNVTASFTDISNVVPGTDVLVVRGIGDDGIKLVSPFSDSAQMFVDPSATGSFEEGEILMVTDCSQATIFQATTVQPAGGKIDIVHSNAGPFTPGNFKPQKDNVYGEGAEIARLKTAAYYIRVNPAGRPALYRSALSVSGGNTIALNAEELVEGVENMQVEYGEDTNGDRVPDSYVSAAGVSDWENVITVRIALLFDSITAVKMEPDTATYPLFDTTYDPADDRQLRKVFYNTVAIRNRLPN